MMSNNKTDFINSFSGRNYDIRYNFNEYHKTYLRLCILSIINSMIILFFLFLIEKSIDGFIVNTITSNKGIPLVFLFIFAAFITILIIGYLSVVYYKKHKMPNIDLLNAILDIPEMDISEITRGGDNSYGILYATAKGKMDCIVIHEPTIIDLRSVIDIDNQIVNKYILTLNGKDTYPRLEIM